LDKYQLYKVVKNTNVLVEICEGCDRFCSNEPECNEYDIVDEFDPQIGVICLEGYFFTNDNCEKCLDNCATCSDV